MHKSTIKNMVGKTPLVRAKNLEEYLGISKIYLKLEGNNPSGHRLDRLAYLLIKDAISINKRTICIGTYDSMCRSLALLSQYYDVNCVFVFPTNIALDNNVYDKENIQVIEHGTSRTDCIKHSKELCKKNDWYNANLGVENNILNMTALSYIAEELHRQTKDEINTVFSLMSYGFTVSGLDLGFRKLWINDEIERLPKLYNCTIDKGNIIYESHKKNSDKIIPLPDEKIEVTKYNKHLLNFNSSSAIAQDALQSIYDVNGEITEISEEELIKYTNQFKEIENINFSIENGYPIAGFMKEASEESLSNGTHIILLNDGQIDLNVRKVEKEELTISTDELVSLISHWLMEYTDPDYEIRDALRSAFDKGFVLMAHYNNELAGIAIVVHTSFEDFIPTYHLGYIATKRTIKGRGIATQLLNKAIEESNGNISLHVEKDNDRAIKLYEKMGFEKSYFRMIHKSRNHI